MPDPDLTSTAREACDEALKRIAECARRRVTVLDLSGLALTSLPSQIAQLAKLTELDVSSNRFAGLPPELGLLVNLVRLDLSHNLLASLPAEIGQLTQLLSLDLSHNLLPALPPEIGQLARLSRLDLSHNLLASLPPELGGLAHLTRLHLSNNRLQQLPAAIGRLANLTRLYLAHNRLTALPPEIGALASLTRLDASHNQLVSLPPELGRLAKLTVLELADNQLASLPEEIGGLAKLTVLGLAGNRLDSLPETLGGAAALETIHLHDNPGLHLSPTVLGPDPRSTRPGQPAGQRGASAKAILDFYFARRSGKTRPVNEARLILLGPAGAGKTSIVQAMRDLPFHDREESTPGVALCDLMLDAGGGAPLTVHVWDFSGQAVTRPLHPFFFSGRALYVVVLSGRGGREHADAEDALRLIREFGADDHGQAPPVIVALNQWNVPGRRPAVERTALREQYPFIRGFVETDCKIKKGIPVLKAALGRELERMPWVREPFPEAWHAVRHALAAGGPPWTCLTDTAYRALCADHGVRDEGQQDYLADFLHHLGTVLRFRDQAHPHPATLPNPAWLAKHAYALRLRAQLQAGILTRTDLELALYQDSDDAARDCLLRFLEHAGITRPLPAETGGWLVAAALPDTPPAPLDDFRNAQDAVRIRATYPSLPDSLVARFIARRHDFIETVRERRQLWRHGLVLFRQGARALVLSDPPSRQVTLTVIGPDKARRQLAALCQAELREIHAAIPCPDPAGESFIRGEWLPLAETPDEETAC